MVDNAHKKLNYKIVIFCILGLILIGSGLLYMHHVVSNFDKVFPQSIYVHQIHVGGLTKEEAYTLVEEAITKQLKEQAITVAHNDQQVILPLNDFEPNYPIDDVLDEAFKLGHEGNWIKRYQEAKNPSLDPKYFEIEPIYQVSSIVSTLSSYEETFYIAPIDATLTRKQRQFEITPETLGEALDTEGTAQKIVQQLNKGITTTTIEAVVKPVEAKTTAADLKLIQAPIASFSTAYNNSDINRNQNLNIASKKINKVLAPEEIFSLGEQLEPITANEGYRTSKVIINGKLEEGIGGGVCQIASTLYNAVLLTNLDIVGRANHSLPVAYVPLGRDATYASGSIDFRFQNNSQYPVFIESYCENNRVYVNIFSHTSLKPEYDDIKFSSEVIETKLAPPPEYIKDPELEMGKMVTEITPLDGKTVKLYKLYYNKGVLINKELVNTSYYKARGEVIRIGTKPIQLQYQ